MHKDWSLANDRLSRRLIFFAIGGLQIEVLSLNWVPPISGWHVSRHKHSSYEFHFIPRGRVVIKTDAGTFSVGPGQFYLTGPGVYHEQLADVTDLMEEYCLHCVLHPEKGDELDPAWSALLTIFNQAGPEPRPDEGGGIDLFEAIFQEAIEARTGYEIKIKGLISALLAAAARGLASGRGSEVSNPPPYTSGQLIIRRLNLVVDDNLSSHLTVEDLARSMFLSRRHLSRIVMRETGMTVHDLVLRKRMDMARRLLRDGGGNIAEVGAAAGFSSEQYFSQAFRREAGIAPGRFREEARRKNTD